MVRGMLSFDGKSENRCSVFQCNIEYDEDEYYDKDHYLQELGALRWDWVCCVTQVIFLWLRTEFHIHKLYDNSEGTF